MKGGALRRRSRRAELAPRQFIVQSPLGTCRHDPWDKDKWRRSRQFRRRTFAGSLLFRGAFPRNLLAEILAEIFCILRIADSLVFRSIGSIVPTSICRKQPRVASWTEDSNFSHREICILRGGRPYQHDIATGGFVEIDRHTTTPIITGGADRLKCGESLGIDSQGRRRISSVIGR